MIWSLFLILTCIFIVFGIIGIYRFKDLYCRMLSSSLLDTAAVMTLIIALIIRSGFNSVSLKLMVILAFVMLTGPINNHVISRSAYLNDIDVTKHGGDRK